MASTLASAFLLVTIICFTLILITALDWAYTHPLFHPSREDVRKLVISLEDLLLPMGSFSSELLHPWTPKELSHESNHTTLPVSMTPTPKSGRSQIDWQPPIPKATRDDGWVKPLAEPSSKTSTILNDDSNSTIIPPSTLPTPNVDKLEPSAELPTSAQAATNRGSSPQATLALMFPPPDGHQLTLSAMSRWTRRQTGNAELNAADVLSFTNSTTNGDQSPVLDNPSDQASSEISGTQQSLEGNSCNAGSAVDVPLPEQTVAEIDALRKNSDTMSEEGQKDQKEEEEDSTTGAEKMSTRSKAPEQQDEISTAAVEEVPTKSQAFEVAIRGLVDPDGSSKSNLEDLVALVAETFKGRLEAEEKLKSEIIRFSREEEDLRHDWIDQREYINRVINGQNDFVCEKGVESNRLYMEKSRLDRENSELKKQLGDQEDQYEREIENLEAEKKYVEKAEATALADVEGRISKERQRHEKERLDAVNKHTQEINSQVCLRKIVLNELAETRTRLNAAEDQYEDTIKDKDRTIRGLKRDLSAVEPAVAAAVERETFTKQRLEEQLKDQRKEKDGEIGSLKNQLREVKEIARSANQSVSRWRLSANIKDEEIKRLSGRLDEERATLREEKDYVVSDLKRDKEGLERTIANGEAEINSLRRRVTDFESGEEARSLQSRLREMKRKLRRSENETQTLTEELQEKVKAQESKRLEEAKRASDEKEHLEKRLAEAVRVSKEGQDRTAQKFKEHKEELSREIEDAQSREKEMRADFQREKEQLATQHQDTVREKDEEIRRLEQAVQTAKEGEVAKNEEIKEEKAKVADQKAAKDAADAEKMTLQHQLDDERQASRAARDKASETETNMRKEIIALKSQGSKAEQPQSHDIVSNETSKDAQERAVLLVQANEANQLLLEIGKTGVVQGSPEHPTLCELNDAKLALHKVDYELRNPNFAASKPRLVRLIDGLNVSEERIQQFSLEIPQLVEQAQKTNARLRRLHKILDTNDGVQKDEILEALHTAVPSDRVIRKPRALKRPGKPDPGMLPQPTSTGSKSGTQIQGNSQAQSSVPASGPAFPSGPMPTRDQRSPFANILASVSRTPVIRVHAAPRQEPAAEDQSSVPGALGDSLRPVTPQRPIRSMRGRSPQLVKKPVGWTDEMTKLVRENQDDDLENIEMIVRIVHDFTTEDDKGFEEWLKKLQSDFKAEKSQKKP